METIELEQLANCDHLLRTTPPDSHGMRVISRDSKLFVGRECVGIYVTIPQNEISTMRQIARSTVFTSSARSAGLPTQSSIFGALPRVPNRVDFCRFSSQSGREQNNFASAFNYSERIADIYKEHLPDAYEYNVKLLRENVHADWRPNETPFTTCNFNINHAIKYHRDNGNFRGVLSNVLILKDGVAGGQLVFPELGIAFEQADGALGIFDGQKWIHGVTNLQKKRPDGYRASIVYYALSGMKNCYPYKEETARFKKLRVLKEEDRAKGNPKLRQQYAKFLAEKSAGT